MGMQLYALLCDCVRRQKSDIMPSWYALCDWQHVRLQFETDQDDDDVLETFPISIRHKVARALFMSRVQDCYLFQGCSHEFINQIVSGGNTVWRF